MFVHCLIQLLGMILGYFRLALCMMFSSDISKRGKKHDEQAQESSVLGYECQSENQIKGTKYGNSEGFKLSNTISEYGTYEFQRQSTTKKFDLAHLLRADYDFSDLNAVISYPLQRRFSNSNSAGTSSESDEETEQRMVEEISGVSAKIAGGFPIQCEEDILYPFPFLEESVVHPEYSREASSSLIVNGGPIHCNDSRPFPESQFRDQYINMHPAIKVSGILAEYDQQNIEFYTQAASALRAVLECEEALKCVGCSPGIDHDLIYQDFLSDPDRNGVRDSVQVTDDQSTYGSDFAEVTRLKVPGTESKHASTYGHSPFDGGTETSGVNQSSLIRVQYEDQGATGGAPVTCEVVRSVRGGTSCIVCKKCIVEVKFKPCGHSVCCFECAVGARKCPVCKELILENADLF